VAPLSLGIETAGGVMTKIIDRGSTIPCSKTKIFSTYADNQPAVTIQVFEGERFHTKDCNQLGKFNLEGIPPAPRGVPKIEVSFEMDANNILNVKAEDKGTGKTHKVTISNDSGRLTGAQIQKMVNDAKQFEEEDKRSAEKTKAKSSFESVAFGLRNSLNDSKLTAKLTPTDKQSLETCVNDAIKWLESHPNESQSAYESKQRDLENTTNPIISKAYASPDAGAAHSESDQTNADQHPQPSASSSAKKGPTISEVD